MHPPGVDDQASEIAEQESPSCLNEFSSDFERPVVVEEEAAGHSCSVRNHLDSDCGKIPSWQPGQGQVQTGIQAGVQSADKSVSDQLLQGLLEDEMIRAFFSVEGW